MENAANAALLDLEQLGDEMFEVVRDDAVESDDNAAWAYACCRSASSSCALS
ncbi:MULTISPECIES: hypothetical protein [Streptomyces]|uniref:hypothetical protein n=1 Tax=Streptomyces TaxID=1883 RepID=UPI00163B9AF9|nr:MULTISPECIES: hypothetical protein [Streptomyces]MBC2879045.1 hypothetical protein [Streptomyces sp. TYQ1024]UBI36097.1 hypothetical protein K7I03_06235 [Streptomyces mobaraensis]UKW28692.1 hypothetical protein MCU78_06220 [Streptomyces sp. TYQ1024]